MQILHLIVSTPLNLHHQIRKDLPGGLHDSGFAYKSLYSWLGVSTDEAIRSEISPQLWKTLLNVLLERHLSNKNA